LYYSNGSANNKVHNLFEAFQYYLIDASANLAKDRGACEWFNRTKYSQGRLPIDHYKHDIDNCHTASLLMDWEALRTKVKQYGMRNSTLSAQMPCETSSQITNSTNGIEPPRGAISIKLSKDGSLPQVVPDVAKCHYEFLWSIPNNQGYLELVGIMQKFLDQAISANTNYDPTKFSDGKVSLNQLIKDLLLTYKLGIKTLYYHNTRDGSGDEQQTGCESGGCSV
jgi:ribonucleoside-diphosphate reductase alpha chain